MNRSISLAAFAVVALLGAPAYAQTSAISSESSSAARDAIADEKARTAGESLNSLDPTGTFSNPPSPILNPESGNSGLNMDTTLSTPPAPVNMLPPMGSYGNPVTLPAPTKP